MPPRITYIVVGHDEKETFSPMAFGSRSSALSYARGLFFGLSDKSPEVSIYRYDGMTEEVALATHHATPSTEWVVYDATRRPRTSATAAPVIDTESELVMRIYDAAREAQESPGAVIKHIVETTHISTSTVRKWIAGVTTPSRRAAAAANAAVDAYLAAKL